MGYKDCIGASRNCRANRYYLNHVGYKESNLFNAGHPHAIKYYLNHVGYKVLMEFSMMPIIFMYYLNHVGYKEKIYQFFFLLSLRII